jgi:hypothetical protein
MYEVRRTSHLSGAQIRTKHVLRPLDPVRFSESAQRSGSARVQHHSSRVRDARQRRTGLAVAGKERPALSGLPRRVRSKHLMKDTGMTPRRLDAYEEQDRASESEAECRAVSLRYVMLTAG